MVRQESKEGENNEDVSLSIKKKNTTEQLMLNKKDKITQVRNKNLDVNRLKKKKKNGMSTRNQEETSQLGGFNPDKNCDEAESTS